MVVDPEYRRDMDAIKSDLAWINRRAEKLPTKNFYIWLSMAAALTCAVTMFSAS